MEILNQFYLTKYCSMPFYQLVKELNTVKKPNKLYKMILISSRIVYYLSRAVGGNGFKENLDIQESATISLVLKRLKSENPITIDEIESIVSGEINFFSNTLYNTYSRDYHGDRYSSEYFSSILLEEMKKSLVYDVQEEMTLSMINFLDTSEILIDNYSDQDIFLFYQTLITNGYELDMVDQNYFLELETITEKAIFLNLLRFEYPEIFILFCTLGSYEKLLLISKLKSLNLPSPIKISEIFARTAERTKEFVSGKVQKEIPGVLKKLAKSIVEDKETSMLSMMDDSMNLLIDNFEKAVGSVTKTTIQRGDLTQLVSMMTKESNASTNMIKTIQKIVS